MIWNVSSHLPTSNFRKVKLGIFQKFYWTNNKTRKASTQQNYIGEIYFAEIAWLGGKPKNLKREGFRKEEKTLLIFMFFEHLNIVCARNLCCVWQGLQANSLIGWKVDQMVRNKSATRPPHISLKLPPLLEQPKLQTNMKWSKNGPNQEK